MELGISEVSGKVWRKISYLEEFYILVVLKEFLSFFFILRKLKFEIVDSGGL